jgi:hypothetical protein
MTPEERGLGCILAAAILATSAVATLAGLYYAARWLWAQPPDFWVRVAGVLGFLLGSALVGYALARVEMADRRRG